MSIKLNTNSSSSVELSSYRDQHFKVCTYKLTLKQEQTVTNIYSLVEFTVFISFKYYVLPLFYL